MRSTRAFLTACFVLIQVVVLAQSGSLKGTIKTSDGKPAEAVTITLKETPYFAIADGKGEYEIKKIKPGSYTLVASFTGLETKELPVEVKASQETSVTEIVLKENLNQLKEVVITTQRRQRTASEYVSKTPLKNIENAQVYTVIDKQILQQRQVTNMEDAMKSATGVALVFPATGRAGDGGSIYSLRGFITTASLIDGVSGAVYSNPDANNIERVEVLKGPSATLFGSSLTSFGGAINVVTKKPFDTLGGNVSLTSGSWNLFRLTADFNTPLNKEKTLLFRMNTAYHRQNSWQDYGFTKRMYIAPSLSYKASDKLSFLFQANFSQIQQTIAPWFYADSSTFHVMYADQIPMDPNKYYMGDDLFVTQKSVNAMAQMNYTFNNTWKSQTVFSISDNHNDGPSPYLWTHTDSTFLRSIQVIDGGNTQMNLQQNFNADFYVGSLRFRALVGADYYQNDLNSVTKDYSAMSDVININGPNPNYLDFNRAKYNQTSYGYYWGSYTGKQLSQRAGGYVNSVIDLTDNLIVNLGLRYDHYIYSGWSDPTKDTMIGKYDQGGWSPRVGLIYQVVKNKVSVFANYQNGFQNVSGGDSTGKVFKPQQANQLEGGVKFSLLQDRLAGSVSYYDISVTNAIRKVTDLWSVQDGTTRSKGIEAELNIAAYKGLNVLLGYAYNDIKFTKADSTVNGLRPVSAGAANMAHAFISYTLTNGKLHGLGLGFGGNYSGKKHAVNDRGLIWGTTKVNGEFFMPEYLVLNASAFYDMPKFRLAVNVNNINNERYWLGWNNISLQKPRELMVSATWKF
jgi:iron complex outermembrane recepter protein